MKEENTKKLIGRRINIEELEGISKQVVRKSLRVIASSTSSLYIHKLLEFKDIDTLNDLYQEVATQVILDGYVITKNAFRTVRKYLYNNYEKTEIEIFTTEEEEEKILNNIFYVSYLNNNNKEEYKKRNSINIDELGLTDKQKDIINMYASGTSCRNIAKLLNIKSVGTVSNTIRRFKNKIIEMGV